MAQYNIERKNLYDRKSIASSQNGKTVRCDERHSIPPISPRLQPFFAKCTNRISPSTQIQVALCEQNEGVRWRDCQCSHRGDSWSQSIPELYLTLQNRMMRENIEDWGASYHPLPPDRSLSAHSPPIVSVRRPRASCRAAWTPWGAKWCDCRCSFRETWAQRNTHADSNL